MKYLLVAAWIVCTWASAATDRPQDYAYILPLVPPTKDSVQQLRLTKEVYLYSQSARLDDVRIFDANGVPLPFALRLPAPAPRPSPRSLPLAVFPLMSSGGPAAPLDLDVDTADDGRLLSVKVRQDEGDKPDTPPHLSGLLLDLGSRAEDQPTISALRFTLPAKQRDYSAQVWLDTSNDLQRWDVAGAAELNWSGNREPQTPSGDRLDFTPRKFRYARLRWRRGTPLQFGSVVAEHPLHSNITPIGEQLLVQPSAGLLPGEMLYAVPVGIAPEKIGLQFAEANVVVAGQIGIYRDRPPRFDPILSATFYRIRQGRRERNSDDLGVAPVHAAQWVLRMAEPANFRPQLRLSWQAGTLVFQGNGNEPYVLAVGRDHAPAVAGSLAEVAPDLSPGELDKLTYTTVGPARQQTDYGQREAVAEMKAANAAQLRLVVLGSIALLGVLAFAGWRLVLRYRMQ